MIAGNNFLDYANLFCRSDYQKKDKIIYKYFNIIQCNIQENVNLDFRETKIR